MAGLVLTQSAGFADSIFGKSAAPIHMVLEQGLEAFEQASAYDKIFSVRSSKNYAEKLTALSAMGEFEPVGENGGHPVTDMTEVFSQTIEHTVWKNRFYISREMIDDAKLDVMRIQANKFTQAYGRGREVFGASLIGGAMGDHIIYKGKKFSTKCADGMPLFSKAHPSFYDKKKTQSNMFAGEFSVDTLAQIETAMQNFKGDKDEILGLVPDTIIIPNDAMLKRDVFAAIGADKDPNTANNGFNFQFGRWNVIVWPYLTFAGASTGDKPFILMDSRFNDLDGTAVWFDRVKLEVNADTDRDTNAAVYDGYARYGAGFNNWRGMAIGGVTGGSAL